MSTSSLAGAVAVTALLLVGCRADVDEPDTAVLSEALERDADPADPVPAPTPSDPDPSVDDGGQGGVPTDGAATTGPTTVGPAGSSGTAGSTSAPAPTPQPASPPAPAAPTASPQPSEPSPEPSEEPMVETLAEGHGEVGSRWRFEDDGTAVASGYQLTRDTRLVAHAEVADGQAQCWNQLYASSHQALEVDGRLITALHVALRDGSTTQLIVQELPVGARLEPGEVEDLRRSDAVSLTDETREVWCSVYYEPRF